VIQVVKIIVKIVKIMIVKKNKKKKVNNSSNNTQENSIEKKRNSSKKNRGSDSSNDSLPPFFSRMISRCWNTIPESRPSIEEILKMFRLEPSFCTSDSESDTLDE